MSKKEPEQTPPSVLPASLRDFIDAAKPKAVTLSDIMPPPVEKQRDMVITLLSHEDAVELRIRQWLYEQERNARKLPPLPPKKP